MTRPRKQTVDYFPHSCNHGQTMFIIEQRYGNDGYAFWFKLLELLGKTEGHSLDCSKSSTWKYLTAKTLVDEEKAREILDLLAELEAIDPDLWKQNKVIWSDNFLKGLAFAYRNRGVSIPVKPVIYIQESGICGTTNGSNPQMKVNEMKVNENTPLPPKGGRRKKRLSVIYADDFLEWYGHYPKQVKKAEAAKIWEQLKIEGILPTITTLIESVEKQKRTSSWRGDSGKYIPHPNNWLKDQRWLDKVDSGNGRGMPSLTPAMQALVDWNEDIDREEEIIDVESTDI